MYRDNTENINLNFALVLHGNKEIQEWKTEASMNTTMVNTKNKTKESLAISQKRMETFLSWTHF